MNVKARRWPLLATWILLLIATLIAISKLYQAGYGSLIKQPIPSITGVSQFAVFYLMAQFIERIVELFSDLPIFARSTKNPQPDQPANPTQDPQQQARTIELWLFASILGIILCFFTIGLFQMVGIEFSYGGHATDTALSGIIVGSGTKPLHDVIGFIQSKNP